MGMARIRIVLAAALFPLLAGVPGLAAKPNSHADLDCTYCHLDTPRFGVDTRDTVNFWRAEGDEPQLCDPCHGPEANFHPLGVTPGPDHLATRPPKDLPLGRSGAVLGQVVCTSCHFIHAANADWALLRGFPGSDNPMFEAWQELCRECHVGGLEKRSPHAGDERACAFCHATKPQPGKTVTVTPVGRRLCEFCHGLKAEAHYAGVNPFKEPKDCTGCHDPHLGKDRPARLKTGYFDSIRDAVTLNPHRKRTVCFACHADGKPGQLRSAEVVALCRRCHGSGKIPGMSHPMPKVPAGYTIPPEWPLAGGALTCLTCHMAGHAAGAVPGRPDEPVGKPHLLRGGVAGDRTAVCFRCHSRDQWKGRNPHQQAAEKKTGCTLCHAADPDFGDTDSFVADINIVCLACHDGAKHPGNTSHTVTLTAAMPAVPEFMPLGPGRSVTCATCHNPHAGTPAGHRLRGAKEATTFCLQCHKL
jgi:predicted CXXCH cytochrome family protein